MNVQARTRSNAHRLESIVDLVNLTISSGVLRFENSISYAHTMYKYILQKVDMYK
jgi:hypothetical protein